MPRAEFPSLRHHKPTNQAVVTVRLASGNRKDLYLGRYGTAGARAEYDRVIGLLSANGGVYPEAAEITVAEALLRYAQFLDGYYVAPDGEPTGTAADIKITLGYLKRLFAPLPLAEFGVPELKVVRDAMVKDGRVRNQVNRRVGMVRMFFRWCVEEQLVPAGVLEALRAVRPLAPGRSGAKEGEPVGPADPAAVEKALAFMSPAVRAIVTLLRLTGARPSEILTMRPCDLDRSGDVWVLTPARHKGSWRGKTRVIYLGPESKAVLAPWLLRVAGPESFVLSPAVSEAVRNAERAAKRVTPRWASHMRRNESKRVGAERRRPPAERYDRNGLGLAIRRACRRARVEPFTAYQLRHLKAVELRERYGLEYVRAVLGHSFQAMSDHYSKAADATLASRVAAEAG